jgi:hypothetical protein
MTRENLLATRKAIEQDLAEFTQRLQKVTDVVKRTRYRKNIAKFEQQLILNAQQLLQIEQMTT